MADLDIEMDFSILDGFPCSTKWETTDSLFDKMVESPSLFSFSSSNYGRDSVSHENSTQGEDLSTITPNDHLSIDDFTISSYQPSNSLCSTMNDGTMVSGGSNSDTTKSSKRRKRGFRVYEQKDEQGNWLIPHVPLPRIPKTDIRRNYGQMVANVFNSGSRSTMGGFLNQMMNPDGRYTLHSNGQKFQLARGREMLADYWFETMQESPDMIFRFEAKQIKVRSDGTAVLSGLYLFGGTLVLSTEDQRRRKADWQYMCNSFRLEGNEIAPVNKSMIENKDDSKIEDSATTPTTPIEAHKVSNQQQTIESDLNQGCVEDSNRHTPTHPISSDKKQDDEMTNLANAFLKQHILDPLESSSEKDTIAIDYKTEGIFTLHIDANFRIDSVEATLSRYYLNHQLAPWLQGPNALTEFAQNYF